MFLYDVIRQWFLLGLLSVSLVIYVPLGELGKNGSPESVAFWDWEVLLCLESYDPHVALHSGASGHEEEAQRLDTSQVVVKFLSEIRNWTQSGRENGHLVTYKATSPLEW